MAMNRVFYDRIKSVQKTSKLTKAMEMVAASKMRKAQLCVQDSRPYFDQLKDLAARFLQLQPVVEHVYLKPVPDVLQSVGIIVITTKKGLCGTLNSNLLRLVIQKMMGWQSQGANVRLIVIGSKGLQAMERFGFSVFAHDTEGKDEPNLRSLVSCSKLLIEDYQFGKIEAIYLAYNRFINAMKYQPVVEPLLPLSGFEVSPGFSPHYHYEPDCESVLDWVLKRYLETRLYLALAENLASEQSARMVAMQSASENAREIIQELKLTYNKARQAAITTELLEIIGGAEAV